MSFTIVLPKDSNLDLFIKHNRYNKNLKDIVNSLMSFNVLNVTYSYPYSTRNAVRSYRSYITISEFVRPIEINKELERIENAWI